MTRKRLDCTGLLCPLPVLEAARALGKMKAPVHLTILSDDPAALKDFKAFAKTRKLTLNSTTPCTFILTTPVRPTKR